MKKLVKLPLFLGICGAACAGILAGVNAITAPIIAENTEKKANEAIYATYAEFGSNLEITKDQPISNELKAVGVTSKTKVTAEGLDGMVYACTVDGGYGGSISFQVSYANGKYIGYTDLGNSETSSLGGKLIGQVSEHLKGKDANGLIDLSIGATVTKTALNKALQVISADYLGN